MKALIDGFKIEKNDVNSFILLLSAPVLLTLYYYHGMAPRFAQYFPALKDNPLIGLFNTLWQFGIFFVLVFLIPLLLVKFRFKAPLKNFGFSLGDKKFGFRFVLIVIPFIVAPLIYIASRLPDIRTEYPLVKILFQRHDLVIGYELAYIFLYYMAWEFYFRGFLLFGLREKYGDMAAIMIQTISSCLIHLGKPESEIIGAIVVGILFGVIALRTRSFWYVFLIHAAIGVLTDLFIIFF
ncbi:MAG TPA: type II CAAX endopeptidase family protein [Candidatus Deferrimicrobium sp.]|nr:type II CAAX endopeptidase family protein [Candidatus Deferrimicrobium sp.]